MYQYFPQWFFLCFFLYIIYKILAYFEALKIHTDAYYRCFKFCFHNQIYLPEAGFYVFLKNKNPTTLILQEITNFPSAFSVHSFHISLQCHPLHIVDCHKSVNSFSPLYSIILAQLSKSLLYRTIILKYKLICLRDNYFRIFILLQY